MSEIGFENVNLEDMPCPNGCARDDTAVVQAKDLRHSLPGLFTIVRCGTCGLQRTNPRPTADTIGFYYPDDYGPYLGTEISGNAGARQSGLKHRVKELLSSRSQDLPSMEPGNLLEVGCASGSFLGEMHTRGWHVQGIEFSELAAGRARAQGFDVFSGSLEVAPRPEKELDLIVAWMVLEHFHEPKACLEKLWGWSKQGGRLVFSTPDINSMTFKIFRQYCYDLHIPHHLYFFNPVTVRQMLEATGWRVEKISHQITLSSIFGSMGYWMRETGKGGRLSQWLVDYPTRGGNLQHLLFPISYLLARFGQTGRMTVWARKIDG